MTDWRALCVELLDRYDLEWRARERIQAALAQTAPPAEGEVAELVSLVRQGAVAWEPDVCLLGNMTARQLARAADLLERQQPMPVPVSERWPEAEDCVSNPRTGSGQWCWGWVLHNPSVAYSGRWRMMRREWLASEAVAWLPAHALPIPRSENV